LSLNSTRSGFGGAVGGAPRNPVADTLKELLEGLAEIEQHARRSDPRNLALLTKFVALKSEMQAAAQLAATLRGPGTVSSGSSKPGPF
jgi:hypothetical protein